MRQLITHIHFLFLVSGDVATLYPHSASDEQKQSKNCARVEIFKMTGGTEYIVHDIDENNTIVGKIRFSGTVRVPDEIAVEGFSSNDAEDLFLEDDEDDGHGINGNVVQSKEMGREADIKSIRLSISTPVSPPTFHPPSFGVTVLGNSHGFDKNGSTSGYVLWINGRGVLIDPPPVLVSCVGTRRYSSQDDYGHHYHSLPCRPRCGSIPKGHDRYQGGSHHHTYHIQELHPQVFCTLWFEPRSPSA